MTKLSEDQIVTRVDTRDTEDGTEVRLFHKRKLLHRFGADDVAEGKIDEVEPFLAAKPRSVEAVEEFLITEGADEGDEDKQDSGSIVPNKYRLKYGVTQRCGDDVAEVLSAFVTLPRAGKKDIDGGLDRARLRAVAETNGLADRLADYEARELNGGLLRMNISNILRGMVRRGELVTIGDHVFPAREVEKKTRKRTAKAK